MKFQSLVLVFSTSRSQEVIEHDTILQVQVDVADMVMQAQGMDSTDGKVMLSIDSDGDALDDSDGDALDRREIDPDDPPAQVAETLAPINVLPDVPAAPQAPCGNEVDPPPSCRSPKGNFKVCSMFGDPHITETFRGRTYTEDDRGEDLAHTAPAQHLTSHYGHGLFDMFKSKDDNIHVQGFFCPVTEGRTLGNSLNMAVVKVGNDRVVWKRPQETFKDLSECNADTPRTPPEKKCCDTHPLQAHHDYYMWMYVNEMRVPHEGIKNTGFTNSFMWAHTLRLEKKHWPWSEWTQRNLCMGTNDRKLTIKMATPPTDCKWMPSMVIELAEDEVDFDAKSICSLGNKSGLRSAVDAVSWSDSLFTMDELLDMCKGCDLMPTVEEGEDNQEFSGCNPSKPTEEFTAKEYCDSVNMSDANLTACDRFDELVWKEACMVEICTTAGGDLETLAFENSVDPLETAQLVGRYSVRYYGRKNTQDYEILVACDESVTRNVTGPYTWPTKEGEDAPEWFEKMQNGLFVHSYFAYEMVSQKCPDKISGNLSATTIITQSEQGLYACLAEVPDTTKFTLAGRFYKISTTGGIKRVGGTLEFEYTKEDNYHCACTEHCLSCFDASHCVTCSYGYKLVDGACEKPSIVKQLSGPPQT